jgi:hypothetical protein
MMAVRPRPEYLKGLPTIRSTTTADGTEALQAFCKAQGIDFVWELKLEAEEEWYWLVTKGVTGPGSSSFTVGCVIPEFKQEDGSWETGAAYNEKSVKSLQGIDYMNILRGELDRLGEDEADVETEKRRDETRRELARAMAALGFKVN